MPRLSSATRQQSCTEQQQAGRQAGSQRSRRRRRRRPLNHLPPYATHAPLRRRRRPPLLINHTGPAAIDAPMHERHQADTGTHGGQLLLVFRLSQVHIRTTAERLATSSGKEDQSPGVPVRTTDVPSLKHRRKLADIVIEEVTFMI